LKASTVDAETTLVLGKPLGPHQWDVRLVTIGKEFVRVIFPTSTSTSANAQQLSTVVFIMYSISAIVIKLSILLLYRRLFWVRRTARYMVWIGATVISLFYVGGIISSLVHCVPRKGEGWLAPSSQHRCGQPELQLSAGQGVFGVISDFYLLMIPMLQVGRLKVPISQKFGIGAVFLTGLLYEFLYLNSMLTALH
jgi:hypothetical protein